MKNYKAFIISALLLMVNNSISAITAATSVNIDGGDYTLYEDGTAKIQGISKAVASFTIPHTVTYNDEPFTVTCIGKDAFTRKMQKLVIPNTIELVEVHSLRCNLDSLIIEDGNTTLLSKSENDPQWWGTFEGTVYAFGGDYKYVYYGRDVVNFDLGSLAFNILEYELAQAIYTKVDKIDIGPLATKGCGVKVPNVNILGGEYALKNIDLSNCKTLNINRSIINCTNTSSITNLTIGQHVNSLPNNFIWGMPNLMIVKIAKDATGFNPAELSVSTSLYALDVEDGNSLCIFEDGFLYNPQKTTLFLYMSNYAPASIEFTLPSTLITINDNAFHDAWVTRIEAPSLENIGARAFYNSHLNELITDSRIKTIGKEAFSGTKIGSLKLGNNITEISDRAFYDCENLKIDDEVFPKLNKIGTGAFLNCKSLKNNFQFGNIQNIGESAFYGTGIRSVEINGQIAAIPDSVFANCNELTSITFGNNSNISTIGTSSFKNCVSLESIKFGGNAAITKIGTSAFENCTALQTVKFGDKAVITKIGASTFANCTALESIVFGENTAITEVEECGFMNCPKLSFGEDFIPCLEKIGAEAFRNTAITEVKLNDAVDVVYDSTFDNCRKLTYADLGERVRSIGKDAFKNCDLRTVRLGSALRSVGDGAFNKNYYLENVYCNSTVVPSAFDNSFLEGYDATLHVPQGARQRYMIAPGWRYFANIVQDESLSGVDEVSVDGESVPVEYYDMQGRRVENPTNGVYIKRQGSKVEKVFK